jgi:hypothetical protein
LYTAPEINQSGSPHLKERHAQGSCGADGNSMVLGLNLAAALTLEHAGHKHIKDVARAAAAFFPSIA